MSRNSITTIPSLKKDTGLTWRDLALLTGCGESTLKKYCSDWDGREHRFIDGRIFTATGGQQLTTKKANLIDFTKRLINIMAAKGMMEDEIADRLGMEEEEVEQAINDVFVDAAKSDGASIVKHDYTNASRFRVNKRKKKKAP